LVQCRLCHQRRGVGSAPGRLDSFLRGLSIDGTPWVLRDAPVAAAMKPAQRGPRHVLPAAELLHGCYDCPPSLKAQLAKPLKPPDDHTIESIVMIALNVLLCLTRSQMM
jgi:hypothetical protein